MKKLEHFKSHTEKIYWKRNDFFKSFRDFTLATFGKAFAKNYPANFSDLVLLVVMITNKSRVIFNNLSTELLKAFIRAFENFQQSFL